MSEQESKLDGASPDASKKIPLQRLPDRLRPAPSLRQQLSRLPSTNVVNKGYRRPPAIQLESSNHNSTLPSPSPSSQLSTPTVDTPSKIQKPLTPINSQSLTTPREEGTASSSSASKTQSKSHSSNTHSVHTLTSPKTTTSSNSSSSCEEKSGNGNSRLHSSGKSNTLDKPKSSGHVSTAVDSSPASLPVGDSQADVPNTTVSGNDATLTKDSGKPNQTSPSPKNTPTPKKIITKNMSPMAAALLERKGIEVQVPTPRGSPNRSIEQILSPAHSSIAFRETPAAEDEAPDITEVDIIEKPETVMEVPDPSKPYKPNVEASMSSPLKAKSKTSFWKKTPRNVLSPKLSSRLLPSIMSPVSPNVEDEARPRSWNPFSTMTAASPFKALSLRNIATPRHDEDDNQTGLFSPKQEDNKGLKIKSPMGVFGVSMKKSSTGEPSNPMSASIDENGADKHSEHNRSHHSDDDGMYERKYSTVRRKAVVIAISYMPHGKSVDDAYGCNTTAEYGLAAKKLFDVLVRQLSYPAEDIRLLTDTAVEGCGTAQRLAPSALCILKSMRWLTDGAQPGDRLFLSFSGEASLEECARAKGTSNNFIVPGDYPSGSLIFDTQFEQLIRRVPRGAHLHILLDCRLSWHLVRLPYVTLPVKSGKRSDFQLTKPNTNDPPTPSTADLIIPAIASKAISITKTKAAQEKERKQLERQRDAFQQQRDKFSGSARVTCLAASPTKYRKFTTGPQPLGKGEYTDAFVLAIDDICRNEDKLTYGNLMVAMAARLSPRGELNQVPQLCSTFDLNPEAEVEF